MILPMCGASEHNLYMYDIGS